MAKKHEQVPPKIFLHLARHGKSNKYEMSQKLGLAYSNTHRIIKRLLKQGYIYVAETKDSERNWRISVEYYDLTFTGLMLCLLDKRSYQFIDEIAKQQANKLPLLFGKWSYFEKQGIKKEVVDRLTGAVLLVSESWRDVIYYSKWKLAPQKDFSDVVQLLRMSKYDENKIEEQIKSLQESHEILSQPLFNPMRELTLTVFFGLPRWGLSSKEQETFLSKLKDDPELNAYIETQLDELEKEYENTLNNISSWKNFWKK